NVAPPVIQKIEREPARIRNYTYESVRHALNNEPDMYRGNEEQIRDRWAIIARVGLNAYSQAHRQITIPESEVNEICRIASENSGVEAALLKAFFRKESSFDPRQGSSKLAMGAMQLKPNAIAELHRKGKYKLANPFDPVDNMSAGAELFKLYEERARTIVVEKIVKGRKEYHSKNRTYTLEGQQLTFDQLPKDTRIAIVATLYNRGPEVLKTTTDVGKLTRYEYCRDIVTLYNQFRREE
ncbi:MAG: transglycosylase SLT domain-containing protein, partial [archaeon]